MMFDSMSYEGTRKAPETARFLALSFFAGELHGCCASIFWVVSAALISSHDGARQRCSRPKAFIDPNTFPSGENAELTNMDP